MATLKQIKGNTWCIETGITIPVYFINDRDIILLDSGHSDDQKEIAGLIEEKNLWVKAIINSHIHYDHTGNNEYFRNKYKSTIVINETEADAARHKYLIKAYYWTGTAAQIADIYKVYPLKVDDIVNDEETSVKVEGCVFGLVPLPGHTPGHTGIVTPDDVFYIGDALMDEKKIIKSKAPTNLDIAEDDLTKEKLRGLKYSKYVLAHSGVYDDINNLIDINLEDRKRRVNYYIDVLSRKTVWTREELFKEMWAELGLRTTKQVSQIMFTRNIECMMSYLVHLGEVKEYYEKGIMKYEMIKESEAE